MRRHYIDVLRGDVKEESTFALIYSPDKEDDWKDPAVWTKACPNLGVSVYEDFMQMEFEQALNKGGTTEVNFKTKNLNLWVDAPDVWIQDEKVAACNYGTTEDDLIGQECYAGLDLAAHVDINALALYFPKLRHPAFRMYFWIPEDKILQKEDRVDYRQWQKEGWINVTPGGVVDIDIMVSELSAILRKYDVRNLAFDPAKAYNGVIQGLQKEGFDDILDQFSQGIQNMSEPTKQLEAVYLFFCHDDLFQVSGAAIIPPCYRWVNLCWPQILRGQIRAESGCVAAWFSLTSRQDKPNPKTCRYEERVSFLASQNRYPSIGRFSSYTHRAQACAGGNFLPRQSSSLRTRTGGNNGQACATTWTAYQPGFLPSTEPRIPGLTFQQPWL